MKKDDPLFNAALTTKALGVVVPFMVHVEEFAEELVDGVLGLKFHVHGQEEGGEEENGTREANHFWWR